MNKKYLILGIVSVVVLFLILVSNPITARNEDKSEKAEISLESFPPSCPPNEYSDWQNTSCSFDNTSIIQARTVTGYVGKKCIPKISTETRIVSCDSGYTCTIINHTAQCVSSFTPGTCFDGVKNQDETDVDCGGSTCTAKCSLSESCLYDSDCGSGDCINDVCSIPVNTDCASIKYDNNSTTNHTNIVVVPYGYGGDLIRFARDVSRIAFSGPVNGGGLLSYTPFSNYTRINILRVDKENDKSLKCYYNCNGIERLICCNVNAVRNLGSTCTQVNSYYLVIVNNDIYGGAGYPDSNVGITYRGTYAPQVATHELLGHALADLSDEYLGGGYLGRNCDTQSTCPNWDELIGVEGTTCIRECATSNTYRQKNNTIMRKLGEEYGFANERWACCQLAIDTSGIPLRCNVFNSFNPDLGNFCDLSKSLTRNILPSPLEIVISFDPVTERFEILSVRQLTPYQAYKGSKSEPKGNIKFEFVDTSGRKQTLLMDEFEGIHVDIPQIEMINDGEVVKSMLLSGQYTKIKRTVFTVVFDGKISDINRLDIIKASKIQSIPRTTILQKYILE